MSSDKIAVSVKDVSKDFMLPHEKVDSLKSVFAHPFKRRRGIETQHALHDISFDIKEGEFFGIVGRNGSGKSTLLKLIAGIYQPSKGSITVNGRLVPFIELGVGFNPDLTGRENVFLNGALMGYSRKEVAKKYGSIVEFAELERFMDQKLKNYSSGMQVRLAFSVATMLADSDILLVDEVLAVGDADFQRKCFNYFRSLKKNKKTVIFVSHDMNAVVEYCDRAILIENSKLVKEGKPDKIATAYQRIFQETSAEQADSEQNQRWGNGAIVIGKPSLSSKRLKDEHETLEISMPVTAKQDVETPLFGFSIKDPKGAILIGTNNAIKQQRIKVIKAGEKLNITWTVPNVFSDGVHTVSLAAEYDGGGEVADRWEDVLEFEVSKLEKSPYAIAPHVGLVIDGHYEA